MHSNVIPGCVIYDHHSTGKTGQYNINLNFISHFFYMACFNERKVQFLPDATIQSSAHNIVNFQILPLSNGRTAHQCTETHDSHE